MSAWDTEAREILSARLEAELERAVDDLGESREHWLEFVAARAHVDAAELESYVAGNAFPCPLKLTRIAIALGTTTDSLMRAPA